MLEGNTLDFGEFMRHVGTMASFAKLREEDAVGAKEAFEMVQTSFLERTSYTLEEEASEMVQTEVRRSKCWYDPESVVRVYLAVGAVGGSSVPPIFAVLGFSIEEHQ